MRTKLNEKQFLKRCISDQKGLTLIDVAIIMVIIGLLIAPALYALREFREQQAVIITENNILEIDEAIDAYFETNEFYPCPADPNLGRNDLNHGESSMNGASGICREINGSGVAEGAVPYKELNLDAEKIYDGWGHQILYAVDPSRASNIADGPPASPPAEVLITINEIPLVINPNASTPEECIADTCANAIQGGYPPAGSPPCNPTYVYPPIPGDPLYPTDNIQYTLLSHGQDGRGAFTESGTQIVANCDGANAADDENCDNDNVFTARQCLNADSNTTARYDDIFVNAPTSRISDPFSMLSQSDNNEDGVAIGVQYVGIKNDDPRREIDVIGNIKISDVENTTGNDKDGAAKAEDYCDTTGDNCFNSALIGGDVLATPCGTGSALIGIRDNGPVCEPALSVSPTSCLNGVEAIRGGTPICAP